ncbi:MAG: GGDEF domain-containing protein [Nitrospira sp.]
MSPSVKSFIAFVIPGGIIFLAAIGFLRPHGLPASIQGPVHAFPLIVLGFGLFFGWYLSSSRLILSFLVLIVADRAVSVFPPTDVGPASTGRLTIAAVSLLVPLNLLALSLIKEETISSWRGVLPFAVIVLQPILIFGLARWDQVSLAVALQEPLFPWWDTGWSSLTQPSLFAFGAALILISGRYLSSHNPRDSGTFWALLLVLAALENIHSGWSSTRFLSAAGLLLFLAVIQDAHQRSHRDELTGVPGRQAYEETVASLGKKFALAVVGIDQLKHYGNQYGKSVSEQVLRLAAPKVAAACRSGKVFRLAGEELIVLFSKKTVMDTLAILEEIRKTVERMTVYVARRDRVFEGVLPARPRPGYEALVVSASVGVADAGDAGASLDLVTKAAYRALYEAKGLGGNLVHRGAPDIDTRKPSDHVGGRIVPSSEFERS